MRDYTVAVQVGGSSAQSHGAWIMWQLGEITEDELWKTLHRVEPKFEWRLAHEARKEHAQGLHAAECECSK